MCLLESDSRERQNPLPEAEITAVAGVVTNCWCHFIGVTLLNNKGYYIILLVRRELEGGGRASSCMLDGAN